MQVKGEHKFERQALTYGGSVGYMSSHRNGVIQKVNEHWQNPKAFLKSLSVGRAVQGTHFGQKRVGSDIIDEVSK